LDLSTSKNPTEIIYPSLAANRFSLILRINIFLTKTNTAMQKNVSAIISNADLNVVITSLKQAETKLPFLISLSDEERRSIPKMGPKSVDFVGDANETTKTFPNVVPPTFDKAEFAKDTELVKNLVTIKMYVDSLQQKIDDTLLEVGSEAMVKALEVYAHVQLQKDNVPGLKSAFEKMKSRFLKTKRKKEENPELKLS
jgi:hypothetical protein